MKIKLTQTQFLTLFSIFKMICGEGQVAPSSNFEMRLFLAILNGIYKQLYKKAIDKKKKYTVSLSEQEALAFWIFFSRTYDLFAEDAILETTLVQTINNAIHQKFA
jgi:hypothetical protein